MSRAAAGDPSRPGVATLSPTSPASRFHSARARCTWATRHKRERGSVAGQASAVRPRTCWRKSASSSCSAAAQTPSAPSRRQPWCAPRWWQHSWTTRPHGACGPAPCLVSCSGRGAHGQQQPRSHSRNHSHSHAATATQPRSHSHSHNTHGRTSNMSPLTAAFWISSDCLE